MSFWSFYLDAWYWVYFILVPVLVFYIKPEASLWIKSIRLLFLVVLFPILVAPLNYARRQTIPEYSGQNHECWVYDLYSLFLATTISIIYIGWWELSWRYLHKQISWNIKANLKYGLVSNIIILISALHTLFYLFLFLGCSYCGYISLDVIFAVKKFGYFKLIPLVC